MFTKFKVYICMILCMISLVSVGFSSWSIHGITEEDYSGSITSDKIINSKEYVYLDTTKGDNNTGIDCFNYYEYGYLDENGYTSNYGYIKTYYILDLEQCRNIFEDNDSVELTINLMYQDGIQTELNLFTYEIDGETNLGSHNISSSCVCSSWDNVTFSSPANNKKWDYTVTVTFNNILLDATLDQIEFSVEYALFATVGEYFNTFIYPYLYKNAITVIGFKADVYLAGLSKYS